MVPGSPPSFLRALTKEGGVPSASLLPSRLWPHTSAHPYPGHPPLTYKSIYSQAWVAGAGIWGAAGVPPPSFTALKPGGVLGATAQGDPPDPPVSASLTPPHVQRLKIRLHPAPHFLKHFLDLFPLFLLKDSLYRDIEREIYI